MNKQRIKLPTIDLQAFDSFPQTEYITIKNSIKRNRSFTIPAVSETKRRTSRMVTFSQIDEVDFVPIDKQNRRSRAGSWRRAPFHDELWDGETASFRSEILSKDEARSENFRHNVLCFINSAIHYTKDLIGITEVDDDQNVNMKKKKPQINMEHVMYQLYSSFC